MKSKVSLPAYQAEIDTYCDRIIDIIHPDCIVLHGSLARGDFKATSDIDIIVIGGNLPGDFIQRIYTLNNLRDGSAPIEAVGYTLLEWERMLSNMHLTTLEAVYWGIALYGEEQFDHWKSTLKEWETIGLQRESSSWFIPEILRS